MRWRPRRWPGRPPPLRRRPESGEEPPGEPEQQPQRLRQIAEQPGAAEKERQRGGNADREELVLSQQPRGHRRGWHEQIVPSACYSYEAVMSASAKVTHAAITGWGKCLPPAVLTNHDLSTL